MTNPSQYELHTNEVKWIIYHIWHKPRYMSDVKIIVLWNVVTCSLFF